MKKILVVLFVTCIGSVSFGDQILKCSASAPAFDGYVGTLIVNLSKQWIKGSNNSLLLAGVTTSFKPVARQAAVDIYAVNTDDQTCRFVVPNSIYGKNLDKVPVTVYMTNTDKGFQSTAPLTCSSRTL